MDFLRSSAASYIGMALAIVAIVLGVIKPDFAIVAWTLAGVFGYGSASAVRTQIDSKGWKTHAIFVVTLILTGLQIAGVVSPETVQALFVAFAPITGITIQQALAKSPTSSVKQVK